MDEVYRSPDIYIFQLQKRPAAASVPATAAEAKHATPSTPTTTTAATLVSATQSQAVTSAATTDKGKDSAPAAAASDFDDLPELEFL